jgi:beta-lactam-binding protein with PASTA domain
MKKGTIFLILLPFALFLGGYAATYFFLQKSYVVVPSILGKSVREGAVILGQRGLFLAVLREQEDPLQKDGTIVAQLPQPGQECKFQKPVYVTVIKKIEAKKVPAFFGLNEQDANELAKKTSLKATIVSLAMPYSKSVCFAQTPMPGEYTEDSKVLVYISKGGSRLRMVPDVRGLIFEDAKAQLAKLDISYSLLNVSDEGELSLPEHKIIDQRPRPGAFFDAQQGLHLQIQVE